MGDHVHSGLCWEEEGAVFWNVLRMATVASHPSPAPRSSACRAALRNHAHGLIQGPSGTGQEVRRRPASQPGTGAAGGRAAVRERSTTPKAWPGPSPAASPTVPPPLPVQAFLGHSRGGLQPHWAHSWGSLRPASSAASGSSSRKWAMLAPMEGVGGTGACRS